MKRLTIGAIMAAATAVAASVVVRSAAVVEIGVAGRANANASIAASGSFAGLAWAARTADGAADIYAATSRDGGQSFRAPVRVNRVAGETSVSGEQPPRIALIARQGSDPHVVVMWTAKGSSGTRLLTARSTDGGRSFGPAVTVPGSDTVGNRGWESMAVRDTGDVVAAWLDHREVPATRPAGAAPASGAHQHGATSQHSTVDGVARAQLSQIFFATLNGASTGRAVAPGVCYCCKTSVATGANGRVVAVWRHVYAGNVRDIALAKSSDGGRTFASPVRVSEDNWVLDGCPENGPAVAVDAANAIHVVWPTLVKHSGHEPTLALFYAMSRDGEHFTMRQPLPTERVPRHPQIALGPAGTITVAWDEQLSGVQRVVVARAAIDYNTPARFRRETVGAGAYPVIAPLADASLVAWTSGATGETRLRVERLPR